MRGVLGEMFTYNGIVTGITGDFGRQVMWFIMNWTEPQFYAGLFTGVGIILGAFVAWVFAKSDSNLKGFEICYGNSTLFPWIFASQVLSCGLAIFVFRYIDLFDTHGMGWVATFLPIVSVPPALLLLYGPSIPVLLTGSTLSALLAPPLQAYFALHILVPLDMPFIVSNVLAMAVTGIIIFSLSAFLPWIYKTPIPVYPKTARAPEDVYSTSWFIRRCFADFSEPQFYGNEVVGVFIVGAVILDWLFAPGVITGGAYMLPAIMLSQFVGTGVAVFLYAHKYENGGFFATFMPIASVGPACVLVFGSSIPVAVFAGSIGAIMAPPLADFFNKCLPQGIPSHPLVGIVTSMAFCSTLAIMTMRYIGF
jgi:hypothetical protein